MDVRRLRSGELVVAAGAIGLAVLLFMPWFGERSAWEAMTFGRVLLVVTILLALTLLVLTLLARAVSLATSLAAVTVGVGGLTLAVTLYRVALNEPGANAAVSVETGAYLGLACLLAIVGGAWRTLDDERTRAAPSIEQTERVLAVRGAPRPPPPHGGA